MQGWGCSQCCPMVFSGFLLSLGSFLFPHPYPVHSHLHGPFPSQPKATPWEGHGKNERGVVHGGHSPLQGAKHPMGQAGGLGLCTSRELPGARLSPLSSHSNPQESGGCRRAEAGAGAGFCPGFVCFFAAGSRARCLLKMTFQSAEGDGERSPFHHINTNELWVPQPLIMQSAPNRLCLTRLTD